MVARGKRDNNVGDGRAAMGQLARITAMGSNHITIAWGGLKKKSSVRWVTVWLHAGP